MYAKTTHVRGKETHLQKRENPETIKCYLSRTILSSHYHLHPTMKPILILLTFLSLSGQALAQLTLQDSLVAYYPMNGNALDASNNNNHGVVNGAVLTTDRFGTPNSAYFFDGIDDFIDLTANSSNFKPPLPVTISAWVEINDYDLNNVFQNDFTLNDYHGPWLNISNGQVNGHFGNGGGAGPQSRRSRTGTSVLDLNTWYHIAVVIRGAGDITIYINGKEDCGVYSGTGGNIAYSLADGILGVGTSTTSLYYHGKMDDVRLYSRDLTKDEIRELCGVSSGPSSICQGDSVQLDAGYGTVIGWTGNNLTCTTCPNPIAFPMTTTTYQVITENTLGCPDTLNWTVVIDSCLTCDSLNLLADFSPTVNALTVDIADQSTGMVDSIVWDWGDGTDTTSMPGDSISHTYMFPGIYQVCQTVYGFLPDSLCSDSVCQLITIDQTCENLGLDAIFTAISSNYSVNFQDFSLGPIDSAQWTFGDGVDTSTMPFAVFDHTYFTADTFTACLIVFGSLSDGTVCTDTTCIPVITTVASACDTTALTADFNVNISGLTASFSDASFGQDVNEINWNLDGVNWTQGIVGDTVSFSYPSAGVYPICIEAIDWYGDTLACRDTFCMNVEIRPIGLEPQLADERWQVYPNPFEKGFWLQVAEQNELISVEIFDAKGSLYHQRQGIQEDSLFISSHSWVAGVYVVRIRVGEKIGWKKVSKFP